MVLKERIKQIAPEAQVIEGETLTVQLLPEALRFLANHLRYDDDLRFDFLRCLTGMDWGDEGLGVVYHLESSFIANAVKQSPQQAQEDCFVPHNDGTNQLILKVITPRDNPVIPTVSDFWKAAELNEREVYDFFGIVFTGHPDMRRLFLRDDWVGHPLRKDYDASRETNPIRMSNETAIDIAPVLVIDEHGETVERNKILFEDDEYVLNIGPQHPATHGVLRFRVSIEGEIIKKLDVHCGYIHRGIEKMCESLTYQQIMALTDRLDYLSAMQNRHAFCMCVEKALGVELPARVQYIRTIMDELQRINSHLLFFSTLCMDLGALTAFFYGFRDREKILDVFEATTGGRLILNYNVIGGVQDDVHTEFAVKVKEFIRYLRPKLKEYHDVFTDNIIARQRMQGVGIMSRDEAISFGATGGAGRASGWACDVRKRHPYALYTKVNFREILYQHGDCFSRYMVRMDEIVESMNIIEQLIDNIPEGAYQVKMKPVIKLPEGTYFSAVESSRGEFGVYIESRGDKYPYRVKFRSTGLPLIACIETITRGGKIADLIAIGGTLDYIVPDIDR
jgi:NADH-quinone oxidoreductase subunit C/D